MMKRMLGRGMRLYYGPRHHQCRNVMTTHQVRITKGLGDLSEETLRFYRQIGVEEVALPGRFITEVSASRPHVPPAQRGPAGPQPGPWRAEDLVRMRERTAAFGLEATSMGLPLSGNILLGRPGRDA